MFPVLDKLDARRVTTAGCLLLALSLVGDVAFNLTLNGLQQSEVLARLPNLVIQIVSFVLAICEHVGALLLALGPRGPPEQEARGSSSERVTHQAGTTWLFWFSCSTNRSACVLRTKVG